MLHDANDVPMLKPTSLNLADVPRAVAVAVADDVDAYTFPFDDIVSWTCSIHHICIRSYNCYSL